MYWSSLSAAAVVVLSVASVHAVPSGLPFQARLVDESSAPLPANTPVTFAIYDAETGGEIVWGPETQYVTPVNGVVSTVLGDPDGLVPLEPDVFTGSDRFLQLTIDGEDLTPRFRISAGAYTFRAEKASLADAVAPMSIDTQAIDDDAVTSLKIDNGEVKNVDLADDAVDRDKTLDEAGVTYAYRGAAPPVTLSTSVASVSSSKIMTPSDGYLVVTARVNLSQDHRSGYLDMANLSLSESRGYLDGRNQANVGVGASAGDGIYSDSVMLHDVIKVSRGTHTIYLNAKKAQENRDTFLIHGVNLSLLFVPTSYGDVD